VLTLLFILPLAPRHTCDTHRSTRTRCPRGWYPPRSRQIRRSAASMFRHRMSVPRQGGCSSSLAGSRTSGCFAGSASGSTMPSARETPVNLHVLRCYWPAPIGLQSLGWQSTRTLSTRGAIRPSSNSPLRLSSVSSVHALPLSSSFLMLMSLSGCHCLTLLPCKPFQFLDFSVSPKNRSYPAYKTPALRSSVFYSLPHS